MNDTEHTPARGGGRTPGRAANIALWVVQVLMAVFFAFASALPKLIAHESAVDFFAQMGAGTWFMYLIGVLELAGAVALVVPALSGLSGIALVGLMIGAFITQFVYFDGQNAATPVILGVLAAVVAWGRRDRTAALVRGLTGRRR
ncbi:DoxX family protein [Streptomonospora sp. S1-112]|uniref:DoxX family protein n=1 Tax=Streptomonospora mangrovi TaxID=2883123 RepID=A0A9X3NIQ0_9ACTN|nr:DoxX family protein [Streptomonospora mangrovi]MDA0563918.1 DoxX family protein [Streptomonospora mangrovi]